MNELNELLQALTPVVNRVARYAEVNYFPNPRTRTINITVRNSNRSSVIKTDKEWFTATSTAVAAWCAKRSSLFRMTTEGKNTIRVTLVD